MPPRRQSQQKPFWQVFIPSLCSGLIVGIVALLGNCAIESYRISSEEARFDEDLEFRRSAHATDAAIHMQSILIPGTPLPVPTITPMATFTPDPTAQATIPSSQSLYAYFDAISTAEYDTAWNLLSPSYRNRISGDDFYPFADFWIESGPVSLTDLVFEAGPSPYEATYLASVLWQGDDHIRWQRYHLVFDNQLNLWIIDSIEPFIP